MLLGSLNAPDRVEWRSGIASVKAKLLILPNKLGELSKGRRRRPLEASGFDPQNESTSWMAAVESAPEPYLVFADGRGTMFDAAGSNLTSLAMLAECWLRRCP